MQDLMLWVDITLFSSTGVPAPACNENIWQKMVAYSKVWIVCFLSNCKTALVHVRRFVYLKKNILPSTVKVVKTLMVLFSSLIFVKGWLIGTRSIDSSFFNYKKLLSPCRKSTVNIKSKIFIALFYLSLFALQKFCRQPNQKMLLIFYISPKFKFWKRQFICRGKSIDLKV